MVQVRILAAEQQQSGSRAMIAESGATGALVHSSHHFRRSPTASPAEGPAIGEVMASTEALLFGRRTWQGMAAAWPERAGDPFADRMNEIPKYVASRTLSADDLTWAGSTLLPADDAIGAIRGLRARDGKGIQVMGSPSLAAQLVEHDLVDEYRLMIQPILLGGGKRVFPFDGQARPLELVSSVTAGTGVLICTYRPVSR